MSYREPGCHLIHPLGTLYLFVKQWVWGYSDESWAVARVWCLRHIHPEQKLFDLLLLCWGKKETRETVGSQLLSSSFFALVSCFLTGGPASSILGTIVSVWFISTGSVQWIYGIHILRLLKDGFWGVYLCHEQYYLWWGWWGGTSDLSASTLGHAPRSTPVSAVDAHTARKGHPVGLGMTFCCTFSCTIR